MQILAGLVILLALMMLARWFVSTTPQAMVRTAKWTGAALLLGGGALMLATGRAGWALAAAAGLLPWVIRLIHMPNLYRSLRVTFRRMSGAASAAGNSSRVETRFLSMTLDHDTGALVGKVVDGPFRGMKLSQLSFDEALELHRQCAADPQSAQVLEAWLERTWPDWRERTRQRQSDPRQPGSGRMSREEALAILGLEAGATPAAIKSAHRRLMSAAHPDRGGSNYLAAKINQAKDTLLNN